MGCDQHLAEAERESRRLWDQRAAHSVCTVVMLSVPSGGPDLRGRPLGRRTSLGESGGVGRDDGGKLCGWLEIPIPPSAPRMTFLQVN